MANNFDLIAAHPDSIKLIEEHLIILKNEIDKQLEIIGANQFKLASSIQLSSFNSGLYFETEKFLITLKRYYKNKHIKWSNKLDSAKRSLTSTISGKEAQKELRRRNYNQTLAELLEGKNKSTRIVENNESLIQKIYPIYYKPNKLRLFDVSTLFYAPEKVVFHKTFGTLYVNLAVIILMIFVLMISLYYDWLKKILDWIEDVKLARKFKKIAKKT